MTTPTDAILGPVLAADPGSPLVTHYDVALGSRIELSAASTANWAAKIAGLLRDEVGVAPGDRVLVDLPAHWLTAGVLLGVWWAGAEVVTPAGSWAGPEPIALVTTADRLDRHPTDVETLVMTTDPMARPVAAATGTALPAGVLDLAESCRIHPDAFVPAGAGAAALDGAPLADLADAGTPRRALLVCGPVDPDATDPDTAVDRLARVLASGAAAVVVTTAPAAGGSPAGSDETVAAEIERIAGVEKTTGAA